MHPFLGLIRHDLRLAGRQGGDIGLVLGFFVLAVILFPFGIGPEPELLRRVAAGIIWVAALLAAVLSLDRLFAADYADGGLDLIALSAMPLELAVLAKGAAHWLTTGLPLVVVSPVSVPHGNVRHPNLKSVMSWWLTPSRKLRRASSKWTNMLSRANPAAFRAAVPVAFRAAVPVRSGVAASNSRAAVRIARVIIPHSN